MNKALCFLSLAVFFLAVASAGNAQILSGKRFEFSIAAAYLDTKDADYDESSNILNVPLRL